MVFGFFEKEEKTPEQERAELLEEVDEDGVPLSAKRPSFFKRWCRCCKLPPWKYWFFSAGFCVFAGGVTASVALFLAGKFALKPFDFLNELYMVVFGLVMLILDSPVHTLPCAGLHLLVQEFREAMFKYCLFLTRFTGRGLWYFYLGCLTFATLWEHRLNVKYSKWLAVVLGSYIGIVGFVSTVAGMIKSRKLERVRYKLYELKVAGTMERVYKRHARQDPAQGMNKMEFNGMANESAGVNFDSDDRNYVFDAITTPPHNDALTLEDLDEWCREGGMTLL